MFKLFGGKNEDKKIQDQKILIDKASNTLNKSLNLYCNNCVLKKKSKNLFDGQEYFYLFLCAAFGFTYEERNLSDDANEYFSYIDNSSSSIGNGNTSISKKNETIENLLFQ